MCRSASIAFECSQILTLKNSYYYYIGSLCFPTLGWLVWGAPRLKLRRKRNARLLWWERGARKIVWVAKERKRDRRVSEWMDGGGARCEVRGARRGGLREKSRGEVLPTANSKVLGTKWSRIRWRGGWGVAEKRTEIVDRWFWKGRTNFGRLDGRPLEFERTLASLPLAPATPPVIREPMLRSAMEKCY